MPPTKRVLYSIDPEVVTRFHAIYKGRERSRAVERLMLQAINEREAEVAAAARLIETDPEFAEYRKLSAWADAQAVDTLANV